MTYKDFWETFVLTNLGFSGGKSSKRPSNDGFCLNALS